MAMAKSRLPAEQTRAWRLRMYTARKRKGYTLDQAAGLATALLSEGGNWGPGKETVRRMESGPSAEDTIEAAYLMALAAVYEVPLRELSEFVWRRNVMATRLGVRIGLHTADALDESTSTTTV